MKGVSYSIICLLMLCCLPAFSQDENQSLLDPVIEEQEFSSFEEGSPESEFISPVTDEGASLEPERQEDIFYPEDAGTTWDMEGEDIPEAEYVE